MIAFETVPTTIEELTEWTDHTGSPHDTVEHIAAGAVEEALEAYAAALALLRCDAEAMAKNAGRVKRKYRGDAGYDVLNLTGMDGAALQPLIDRFVHESGDMLWYACRAMRLGFGDVLFVGSVNATLDLIGLSRVTYNSALEVVTQAGVIVWRLLRINEDTFIAMVLAALHTRLVRRKLAGTMKGEGDR